MMKRVLVATISILLVAVFALPGPNLDASAGLFDSPPPTPLQNDDFDNATVIDGLPFTDAQDTSTATWASDDPDSCSSNGSVWYTYTPTSDIYVDADTIGSGFDTVLSAYTGTRGSLEMVPGACNDDWYGLQSRVRFRAIADTTYYFLVGFCCGNGGDGGGDLVFSVQETSGPANDDFENAQVIGGLPFEHHTDTWSASLETGEPVPSCVGGDPFDRTVWYSYTPEEGGSVTARIDAWFGSTLAVYTGDSLSELSEVSCRRWSGQLTQILDAGTTYYFQTGGLWAEGGDQWFYLEVTPPPVAEFGFDPYEPSVFDTVWFHNWSYDPAGVDIESVLWDFGDGSTSTEWWTSHRYASDGVYTVNLTVTTYDGRTDTTSREVQVRTHDVAITKFLVPNAAKAGQTRPIVVGLSNALYPEEVEVRLYRSVPGGYDAYEWVGTLVQSVPVRRVNRTTDFRFSYTFTDDDAYLGKVTFKAEAQLRDAHDALPADNEAISRPVKVMP
jgi:PKD repeat protein